MWPFRLQESGWLLPITDRETQSITLINRDDETVADEITIPKSWVGLAFSQDEKRLFASGGNDNLVRMYQNNEGKLSETGQIVLGEAWPKQIHFSGGPVPRRRSPAPLCSYQGRQRPLHLRPRHPAGTTPRAPSGRSLYLRAFSGQIVPLYLLVGGRKSAGV